MTFKTLTATAEDGEQIQITVPVGPLPTMARVDQTLQPAFNLVADPANWKNPIDRTIDLGDCEDPATFLATIKESIEFYTATDGTVAQVGPTTYRITAPGYYAGPAN